ncbi:MAG TPA: sigma-70 family RNA polymerase sigma factor [Solirubrobacteraceae bacterium]|jgi:RNA polymerase sigma-70 factor (ECF subfamily)|nr:sigma-70 family RNA polymerase sigma factor [Solirubrobacteraceae bacterium]
MAEMTWQSERLEHNRLARAQRGDEDAFAKLTEPYARELQLHCYRIVGSLQDAEDLLQETMLAAWRGLEQFEGRSSLRAWLYTIATNRCLNALRDRQRRPQAAPGDRAGRDTLTHPPESVAEIAWLQPYPDALLEGVIDAAPGPEARYEAKESVALAFVSGLQHLAPRQRAVLVLRDVLGFHADEVADMLGSSEASVNSALQRARGTLDTRMAPRQERLSVPSGEDADIVHRFAAAFESDDVDAVVALLTEDAVVSMPPEPEWHQGRAAIERFLRERHAERQPRAWRFVPVGANLQPAYAYYLEEAGEWMRGGMFVLGVRADGITSVTRFPDGGLLDRFGAPPRL